MSIWSPQDVARDAVRRQAAGLDVTQVAENVAEAARRKRETSAEVRRAPWTDTGTALVAADPHRLAETWSAKHTEWQRIHTLLQTTGHTLYEPDDDATGTQWAREREDYRQERLAAFAAHREQRRREGAATIVQLWLTTDQAGPLQHAADRAGLTLERLLAHLAARVEADPDGTLFVPAFHPDHP
ncbi:hypothetical protein [Streptomyces roseolus]|uniref:hypothetical protein n=1 Tax=Streptomyces roseolus TaxID=67358 RepID=UPI0036E8F861